MRNLAKHMICKTDQDTTAAIAQQRVDQFVAKAKQQDKKHDGDRRFTEFMSTCPQASLAVFMREVELRLFAVVHAVVYETQELPHTA
eukprot:3261939-Karenia_brevis.AAC.1